MDRKVRQLIAGAIIWNGRSVIGVKGINLPKAFYDCDCRKVNGGLLDYELSPANEYDDEQKALMKAAEAE